MLCGTHRDHFSVGLDTSAVNSSSFLRRQIVDGALRFARDHKDATGFAPAGFAVYFVRREGARARMAHGAYRCAGPACRSRV